MRQRGRSGGQAGRREGARALRGGRRSGTMHCTVSLTALAARPTQAYGRAPCTDSVGQGGGRGPHTIAEVRCLSTVRVSSTVRGRITTRAPRRRVLPRSGGFRGMFEAGVRVRGQSAQGRERTRGEVDLVAVWRQERRGELREVVGAGEWRASICGLVQFRDLRWSARSLSRIYARIFTANPLFCAFANALPRRLSSLLNTLG
ncbi:hypothetical protein C2E23DRAFT_52162 [Lenzites betulinus]|nr:hypothetical protein C2E23DRAFT_52162 [Lenzites betulinus]